MNKIIILGLILLTVACSKPNAYDHTTEVSSPIETSSYNIVFDSSKKTDQNAAEIFDLGLVGTDPITKIFNITNTTGSNLILNFSDLQQKIAATTRFSLNLFTATPCPTSLKTNKTCSFELTLKKVSNESYDAIATNIIDASSRGTNSEFGSMIFSGVKSNDISSEIPLSSVLRIDRLADSFIVPYNGTVSKRFYIGNISTKAFKTPSIVAPNGGTISTNSCAKVTNLTAIHGLN